MQRYKEILTLPNIIKYILYLFIDGNRKTVDFNNQVFILVLNKTKIIMNYMKSVFKNLMLANIFWLICGILMTSSIFFSGGVSDYNSTVLNVSASIVLDSMFIFTSMLARNHGALFTKLFGY